MQALHYKLYVVLDQILPYNCSETYYSFCEYSPSTQMWVSPFKPSAPTIFSLRCPCLYCIVRTYFYLAVHD